MLRIKYNSQTLTRKQKQRCGWLGIFKSMFSPHFSLLPPFCLDVSTYSHTSLPFLYPGGPGTMAYTFCQYYPNIKITVCEVQSVVDLAHQFHPSSEDCPNQANVSYVVGDFFQPDLPKADLYVLSRVLHDWSEEKVNLILSNVFKSLPSGIFKVFLYGYCLIRLSIYREVY